MQKSFPIKKLIKFLFLLTLTISLNSCSDDDDDNNSNDNTFLETLDGSKWKLEDEGGTIYIKITNNEINPLEIWVSFLDAGCYINGNALSDDDSSIEIIENSATKLVIKTEDSSDEYDLITFTKNGDKLSMKIETYYNGVLDDTEVIQFNKTTTNLDNLELCDFDFETSTRLHQKLLDI